MRPQDKMIRNYSDIDKLIELIDNLYEEDNRTVQIVKHSVAGASSKGSGSPDETGSTLPQGSGNPDQSGID